MMDTDTPAWERRYRAPRIATFSWSPSSPDRIVFVSNESGIFQVHALDRVSGLRRRVTDHGVGVADGVPTHDGGGVAWFQDETGDESGRWIVQPFEGGEARPLVDGVPHGWNEGFAQGPGIVAAAVSDRDGFGVYVALDHEPAREICRSRDWIGIGAMESGGFTKDGLSSDGSLLCLVHSEHGDAIHPALRVVDPRGGTTVGEQRDPGTSLKPAAWSPLPGDQRLAITHEVQGDYRPAVWDLTNGTNGRRHDLRIDLEGSVEVLDWWPDGSALLLRNLREGRHRLWRYQLRTGELLAVATHEGMIETARVRPDASVWYLLSRAHLPPRCLDEGGAEVLRVAGEPAPSGRPFVSWHFDNRQGQRVHGFYATPDGDGPFPVIMLVHGGPDWLFGDEWNPEGQAYVDAGFAVGMVNYRGSEGYGREWRDTLIGDVGGPEVEDVNAGLADLVERGIADPRRAVIAGRSWGGYITLLELGKHRELWTCGVAVVPVGDYEAAYDDSAPMLQAYDRALLGGRTPREAQDLMRDRNPIYFVENVSAPVLIIAAEHDSRCPFGQIMAYVKRLRDLDHPHELYVYATGHGSLEIEETIRQMSMSLRFVRRCIT